MNRVNSLGRPSCTAAHGRLTSVSRPVVFLPTSITKVFGPDGRTKNCPLHILAQSQFHDPQCTYGEMDSDPSLDIRAELLT